MPRVSLHTARELPQGADVVLSQELWDLLLGQLQPEGVIAEAGSSSSSSNGSATHHHRVNGTSKTIPPPLPSRIAISITRRYKLENARNTHSNSHSPISSIVCWACLDNLPPLTAMEQQKHHRNHKGKGKSKEQNVRLLFLKRLLHCGFFLAEALTRFLFTCSIICVTVGFLTNLFETKKTIS